MKIIISLLSVLACLLSLNLSAQTNGTFGGVTTTTTTNFILWTGITNAPATSPNGGLLTNAVLFTPPSKYVVLTNVVSTNETFTGSVYMQVPPNLLTNFPGYSNLIYIGSITQSFSNGLPTGGIWSTTTVPVSGSVSFPIIFQANNGIYTNGIFAQ
jgi:hypothetical protein